jgi:hypothetical protein
VFAALYRSGRPEPAEALAGFVLLALLFPALALFFTRRVDPLGDWA